MKRWILCLSLFFLLLTGCGGAAEETVQTGKTPQTPQETQTEPAVVAEQAEVPLRHLSGEIASLPEEGTITAQAVAGERILLGGLTQSGPVLTWLDWEGGSGTLDLPEGTEYLYALCPDEAGGFWLLSGSLPKIYVNWKSKVIFQDAEPQGEFAITHYDEALQPGASISLQNTYSWRFFRMLHTEDGFFLMSAYGAVLVDDTGAECRTIEADSSNDWHFSAMEAREDSLYVLADNSWDEAPPEIRKLDRQTLELQESFALDEQATGLGQATDGALLVNTADGIFTLTPESGQTEAVLAWSDLGFSGSAEQISVCDQGYVVFDHDDQQLTILRWEDGAAPERSVLTMAIPSDIPLWGAGITELIEDFNCSQNRWRVEYTVYSDAEEQDGEPLDILRTKIITGDAPDLYLFYTNFYTGAPMLPKDVCADLLPLLADEVTEDALLPGLYDLLTADGCLYQLPIDVSIRTLIGPSRLFPEMGVTLEDLEEACQNMPEGWVAMESWKTPENLLWRSLSAWTAAFVDVGEAACTFDSEEFQDCLRWCKEWGGDGSTPQEQEITLTKESVVGLFSALCGRGESLAEFWGETGYTYIGYPTKTGSGSAYEINVSLGISSQCREIEGAKEFLRYGFAQILNDSFPGNLELFRSELAAYRAGDRYDWDGEQLILEQADEYKLWELLNSITALGSMDRTLETILQEEAGMYFAGDCTVEQVAAIIQNRVSLYLSER